MWKRNVLHPMLTGSCALGLTLLMWVLIVMLLDRRLRGYDQLLWNASLWLSAISCTLLVAYVRFSRGPVLGCTLAFAIFAAVYMACEGPIFGNVSSGGDPNITMVVVGNLVAIPLGVFVASEIGAWFGSRRDRRKAKPTD
jgi:hypothetical protein